MLAGCVRGRWLGAKSVGRAARTTAASHVPLADRGGEHVGDLPPHGLRLQIEVGACCAFVAVLRNHVELVLTHHNREFPKSAALPQGSRGEIVLKQDPANCCADFTDERARQDRGVTFIEGSFSDG